MFTFLFQMQAISYIKNTQAHTHTHTLAHNDVICHQPIINLYPMNLNLKNLKPNHNIQTSTSLARRPKRVNNNIHQSYSLNPPVTRSFLFRQNFKNPKQAESTTQFPTIANKPIFYEFPSWDRN